MVFASLLLKFISSFASQFSSIRESRSRKFSDYRPVWSAIVFRSRQRGVGEAGGELHEGTKRGGGAGDGGGGSERGHSHLLSKRAKVEEEALISIDAIWHTSGPK